MLLLSNDLLHYMFINYLSHRTMLQLRSVNRRIFDIIEQVIKVFYSTNMSYYQVSMGVTHVLVKKASGQLLIYGSNNFGELGAGDKVKITEPSQVAIFEQYRADVAQCSGSHFNSIVTLTNGQYYACGRNNKKQINEVLISSHRNYVIFKLLDAVKYMIKSIQISISSCALLSDNRLYVWGANRYGQLGLDCRYEIKSPQLMNYFYKAKISLSHVLMKFDSSFALTADGRLFSWGRNSDGQLGLGDRCHKGLPQEVTYFSERAIHITDIVCGSNHIMALSADGRIFSWGGNNYGQLATGDILPCSTPKEIAYFKENNIKIKNIASGSLHSHVVTDSNRIFSWGHNEFGQLGLGEVADQVEPREIDFFTKNEMIINQIVVAAASVAVITIDGFFYAWGWNQWGQLGIGNNINQYEPVEVTFFSRLARKNTTIAEHGIALAHKVLNA